MIMPTRHLAVSLALAVLSSSAIALGADDDDTAKPSKSPDGDENETDAKPPKPAVRAASSKGLEVPITDTREDPNRRYYFVGLRYRGTVIPKFLLNLFVDEGTTIYSNNVAIEFDMRKQGQSTIPWIMYSDYSMGDTLFLQKGQPMIPSNYTVVNSSLKVLYLGLDQLWSIPIDESHHWDFEFGFGVGVGLVFGSLQNDWVYPNSNGSLLASTGEDFGVRQYGTDELSGWEPHGGSNCQSKRLQGAVLVQRRFGSKYLPVRLLSAVQCPLQADKAARDSPRSRLLAHGLLVRPERRLRPREPGQFAKGEQRPRPVARYALVDDRSS